jgi:hypothetical protein
MRDVSISARTPTIRFSAPDAHGGDETGQHLNGWISSFCFVVVRHDSDLESYLYCVCARHSFDLNVLLT